MVVCSRGCSQWIPVNEVESHELMHDLDDEQRGHATAAGPPPPNTGDLQEAARMQEHFDFEELRRRYGFAPQKRTGSCYTCGQAGHWIYECPRRPPDLTTNALLSTDPEQLVQQQRPNRFSTDSASAGSDLPYDRGWGCGWRNIQMASSHLLCRDAPDIHNALFAGSGFVPDIASLQAWLEVAWQAGFDTLGAESLGGKVRGETKWIGTTEASTLFRYFGLQAQIIDFMGPGGASSHPAGLGSATAPCARLEDGRAVHLNAQCDGCGCQPIVGVRYHSLSLANYDLCPGCKAKPEAAAAAPYQAVGEEASSKAKPEAAAAALQPTGLQQQQQQQQQQMHWPLVKWVWDYFTGQHAPTKHMAEPCSTSPSLVSSQPVTCTQLPPLYFQHEGHSRTIIGIERKPLPARTKSSLSSRTAAGQALPKRSRSDPGGSSKGDITQYLQLTAKPSAPGRPPQDQQNQQNRLPSVPGRPPLDQQNQLNWLPSVPGRPPLDQQNQLNRLPQVQHLQQQQLRQQEQDKKPQVDEQDYVYTLLVLDPGMPSAALYEALRSKTGWQRMVRRGVQTLKHPQYQLMYCLDSLSDHMGRECMKIVAASEVYR
eukprot:gene5802-6086_t